MLRGYQNGADVNGGLTFPVAFPGTISRPQTVTLASAALANGTFDILQNVKFYLTGDPNDIATLQGSWPNLGFSYNPQRPQLNGGFQISFDGIDWTTFSIKNPALTGSVGRRRSERPLDLDPAARQRHRKRRSGWHAWSLRSGDVLYPLRRSSRSHPLQDHVPSWPRNIICPARGRAAPVGSPCRRSGQELPALSASFTRLPSSILDPDPGTRGGRLDRSMRRLGLFFFSADAQVKQSGREEGSCC